MIKFFVVKRVLKDNGYLFIAEDLVNTDQEKKTAERADRRLNADLSQIHLRIIAVIKNGKSILGTRLRYRREP